MYVAVKGGEAAIGNAHQLLAEDRRGNPDVPELSVAQIREQLSGSVDRVMTEGSVYDPDLAALALKQSRGDQVEAIFLLRAYRTTLPRLAVSLPIDTGNMKVSRRISSCFKDMPGGQLLGPTFDYAHRLIDFALEAEGAAPQAEGKGALADHLPQVVDLLNAEGLIEREQPDADDAVVGDLTREPLSFPAGRDIRLQTLARADEGYLLALGYSTQRGYARSHPFVGEIRTGEVAVEIEIPELGFAVDIGDITVTECQMVNQFVGSKSEPPKFTRGYGLAFGYAERKAMAMSLVDRALRAEELGEDITAPAQDAEFVLYHADNVEASGFVQHLKLPHHVDFQAELTLVRTMRAEIAAAEARKAELAEAAQ
ncbi:carbon-phosphorus lyase complex subunit PhnI [Ferrovibrio sp.]|uniref:carbon-phosphorus lyase complex subunit PhnI n=1 Tax=Ferrovibrio sp. TaxID=1917215 RepID=UPI000CAC236C|nr:carbon-phosphorus lyase complex subunit PhnI [Ferrovibrio sp.]PJI38627.1 MAG: carbon-phosphorus lyase complex subunit PhnI [Ferrovibrio sp.]